MNILAIIKDYKAYTDRMNLLKKLGTIFLNPCFHSVVLFRLSSFFGKIHLSIIAKMIWYLNRVLYNVDIDWRADIKGGLCIIHGLGIVIGANVQIKGKCKLYQGVTIGGSGKSAIYQGKEIWQPVIDENVIIYSNAMVLGPVYVAKDSVIKAGRVVTKNIGC